MMMIKKVMIWRRSEGKLGMPGHGYYSFKRVQVSSLHIRWAQELMKVLRGCIIHA